ncbi:MAG: Icc-like protein [Desulfobulbaceae bacterium]|nr:MAG: Icc-like protein [Desulfobulbaceae bacterium]
MKLLTVSDRINKSLLDTGFLKPHTVDLILGCGDLPPEYLGSLHHQYQVPLFYVQGNHDIRTVEPPPGCINISGRIVSYRGKSFLGFSGSRWYNGNQNQYHEKEMRVFIRRLWFKLWRLKKLDVIATHTPPRFIHDKEDPCHKGFRCYNDLIRKQQPRFFIHGHIHEDFKKPEDRITTINHTVVLNTYDYHVLEI